MIGPILQAVLRTVKCVFGWVPVVFAACLFAEAYYGYVRVFCGAFVTEVPLRVTLAAVFHLLLLFCLWSFAKTTLTPPSPVPRYFEITSDERRRLAQTARNPALKHALLEAMAAKRGVLTRCIDGTVNYCDPCQRIKPDRCHHCSSCEKCIPKMDHHCPWFNNCVGFSTYKFFLLTLFYLVLLCAYVAASMSLYMLYRAPTERHLALQMLHPVFLLVVAATMFCSVGCFLCMHASFVMENCTTLESTRPPTFKERGDSFNVGAYANVVEVFGPKTGKWLIPVFTSVGDGSRFPTRLHPDRNSLASPPRDSPRASSPSMKAASSTKDTATEADSALSTAPTAAGVSSGASSQQLWREEVPALRGAMPYSRAGYPLLRGPRGPWQAYRSAPWYPHVASAPTSHPFFALAPLGAMPFVGLRGVP